MSHHLSHHDWVDRGQLTSPSDRRTCFRFENSQIPVRNEKKYFFPIWNLERKQEVRLEFGSIMSGENEWQSRKNSMNWRFSFKKGVSTSIFTSFSSPAPFSWNTHMVDFMRKLKWTNGDSLTRILVRTLRPSCFTTKNLYVFA